MQGTLTASGLKELESSIRRAILGAPRGVRRVNREFAPILLQTLVEKASGRPGPDVVTGAYIAAFSVKVDDRGYSVVATNNSPQAHRLEYGFVGVDALGRNYAQPPFPHFRPAIEEIAPRYQKAMEDAIPGWMR